MKSRSLIAAALLAVAFAVAPSANAATPTPVENNPTVGPPTNVYRCASGRRLIGPDCDGAATCLGTDYENVGTCKIRCKSVVGTITQYGPYATCTVRQDTFEGIEDDE